MISVVLSEFITLWVQSEPRCSRDRVLTILVANPYFESISEALAENSKAVLFSPDRENTSAALQATGLEKH